MNSDKPEIDEALLGPLPAQEPASDLLEGITDAIDKADESADPVAQYLDEPGDEAYGPWVPEGEFGFEVDGVFFAADTPKDAFEQFLKTREGARARGRKVTIRPCERVKVPEAAPPKNEKA